MTRPLAALVVAIGMALASVAPAANPPAAPLTFTEPVGVARANVPASGGAPVGLLHVRSVRDLVVVDAAGRPVPAQISPMVTLEGGELAWVLVDLLTDAKPGETKQFAVKVVEDRKEVAEVPNAVTAVETDDAVTMRNGLVRVALSKTHFDLFDNVWVSRNGAGQFTDDEQMLAAGDGSPRPGQLIVVRGDDHAGFSTRDGKVQRVTFEDAGPVRTTVRIDGEYGAAPTTQPRAVGATAAGTPYLKYTARVTMWADRADIRVLYAIRNTNPAEARQEKIERATVRIKLNAPADAASPHYLVGGGGSPGQVQMSQLSRDEKDLPGAAKGSQWHRMVQLSQVGPPEAVISKTHRQFYKLIDFADAGYRVQQFQPGGRSPTVDVGFKCSGWLDLATEKAGCQLWLRDFTYDTPKKMWAATDGTLAIDLIPEYDGDRQPYYNAGGYWLGDRSHRTYELNFHFHARPLVTAADWAKWKEAFNGYVPVTPQTAASAEAIAQQARHPLVLVSTPAWYSASGSMWGPMPSLDDEAVAAKAVGRTKAGPVRPQPAEAQATEFLHYENFHYWSEWDEPGDAIYEFLRTGDWQFFKRANSFGRNYRDFGVDRTDGLDMSSRTQVKQPGAAGPVDRWGKFCPCHKYGWGILDLWLITGDRSYRDAGVEFGYDQAQPAVVTGGFGGRDWGRQMISVLRAYEVTRDPKLKAWLVANCRPIVPDEAMRADGRGLICGKHQGSWMTGLCSHAIWHNYRINRDAYSEIERDDYEDGIVGIARNVAKYWYFPEYKGGPYYIEFDSPETLNKDFKANIKQGAKPGNVYAASGGEAYTLSCTDMMVRGYLLTGDRKLLDQARLFWDCVNGDDKQTQSARLQDFEGMGSCSFWARQLIYELAHPRADEKGPAAIKDLKATLVDGAAGAARKVKLTWTAPSDAEGMVARYQVKHAPCPIVTFEEYKYPEDHTKKWTWWAGYNVAGEPRPAPPGAAESMVVDLPGAAGAGGAAKATVRYFCIISKDDAGNESDLSNLAAVEVK